MEGFAKAYGRDTVEVKERGAPALGHMRHRGAIEAMAEKGIDISRPNLDSTY